MEPPVSPEPPFWPNEVVPAAYVLEHHIVPHSQALSSAFPGNGIRFWNDRAGDATLGDFAWTHFDSVYKTEVEIFPLDYLSRVLEAKSKTYWILAIPDSDGDHDHHWIKVTAEIAALVWFDLAQKIQIQLIREIFLFSEDQSCYCSGRAIWQQDYLLSNVPIQKDSYEIKWPEWVKIIFRRYSDHGLYRELVNQMGNYFSYLTFAGDPWSFYVQDVFREGDPAEMEKMANTLYLLDHDAEDDCENHHALTVYDDLALLFYADDPQPWTDRLWEYLDPLNIYVDMSTSEFIEMSRARRLQRDASLIKQLRNKGRLWRENPRVKGLSD